MPDNTVPTSGLQPAEGRDDLGLPGADRAGPPSENPEGPIGIEHQLRDIGVDTDVRPDQQPDELADRVGIGMPDPGQSATPDLLPNVEVPRDDA